MGYAQGGAFSFRCFPGLVLDQERVKGSVGGGGFQPLDRPLCPSGPVFGLYDGRPQEANVAELMDGFIAKCHSSGDSVCAVCLLAGHFCDDWKHAVRTCTILLELWQHEAVQGLRYTMVYSMRNEPDVGGGHPKVSSAACRAWAGHLRANLSVTALGLSL